MQVFVTMYNMYHAIVSSTKVPSVVVACAIFHTTGCNLTVSGRLTPFTLIVLMFCCSLGSVCSTGLSLCGNKSTSFVEA